MASDFAQALAEEIGGLESQLEADPRYMKLRELRRVQALYQTPALRTQTILPKARTAGTGRSPTPERQAILEMAKTLLRTRTFPMPTSEMHDLLVGMGTNIPGASPKNNLSAMLSNSDDFVSHGRSGWTLAQETPETSDDLVSRSTSEASMSSPASPAGEQPSVRPVDPAPGGGG